MPKVQNTANRDLSEGASRRQFIKSGLGCLATLALGRCWGYAAAPPNTIPIGFQLFTVRAEFARDVPGTLKKLGQIGYKGVEFWDYAGTPNVYQAYSAADLRRILNESGLKCCGMHVKLETLSGDNLKRTIANSHALGNDYINLVMAPEKMKSEAGIAELAALLNQASAQCRQEQLVVGYHCHGFDFARINGRFAWKILFSQIRPEVNMQLDVGNCLSGGGDPIAILKEFPARSRTVHIKEYKEKTFDTDFYREVFRLCDASSVTKWYIVEMGSPDGSGFEVPTQALGALRRLGRAA
jgi:sugar phosphate isomerase/epimerase